MLLKPSPANRTTNENQLIFLSGNFEAIRIALEWQPLNEREVRLTLTDFDCKMVSL